VTANKTAQLHIAQIPKAWAKNLAVFSSYYVKELIFMLQYLIPVVAM
jgi:hypothetical protein